MIFRRILVLVSDNIVLCSEFHIAGVEEHEYHNRVFFIAFVNPTFPLQNSSLTNFVPYLGNAVRASTIKFSLAHELKIR
jgi:hypothetical protein